MIPTQVWRSLQGYQKNYFAVHPTQLNIWWGPSPRPPHALGWRYESLVWIHHAIPQDVLKKYQGIFKEEEIHSYRNLRGIPKGWINGSIHLSALQSEWMNFFKRHPTATRQQIEAKVAELDRRLGTWFKSWSQVLGVCEGRGSRSSRSYARRPLAASLIDSTCRTSNRETAVGEMLSSKVAPREAGGIDFSSLKLRYLSESSDNTGLRYAFSAAGSDESVLQNAVDGLHSVDQASDAFFAWLVLPTDKLWVNLNPNEPDRITDARFGRTDAGRILLEADLEMKKTVARLIHPDTKLGARFWNSLRGSCFSSRQWIVPAPATVRESRDELYILDAPLSVLMETEYVQDRGSGKYRSCAHMSKEAEERNERLYKELILPKVEKAVNTAPEYADLRRVYLSRVAAEWYRNRSHQVPSAFSHLIDTGNVKAWESGSSWKPIDTFNAYVRSFTKGEFNITRKTRQGNYTETRTYVYGGVNFDRVLFRSLSDTDFEHQWPGLSDTVKTGLHEATTDRRTNEIWLGGTSIADSAGNSSDPQPERKAPVASRSHPNNVPTYVIWLIVGAGALLMVFAIVIVRRRGRQHA